MVSAFELEEVEELEKTLAPVAGKWGGDFKTKALYLDLVRKYKLRRSELVAKYGIELLNSKADRRRLQNDLWTVYEQVAIAAMDCHDLAAAKECVGCLMKRFPGSLRVARLEGMWLEAKGWWEQADRLYSNLLEEHPAESSLHKRKIALLKEQGQYGPAIDGLNKYLQLFMADHEGWRELGDIYIQLQMYKQAAFCYEELILFSPVNPIFNLTYAEILYTLGGVENLRTARRYYAAAVEYSGGKSMRALYGVCLCASALTAALKSARGQKEEESGELPSLAAEVIEKEYKHKSSEKLKIVKGALKNLSL